MALKRLDLFVGAVYTFDYTNHRNEVAKRLVTFGDLQYGTVEPHYTEPTWLLSCFDHDKNAWRSFALSRIDAETWSKM